MFHTPAHRSTTAAQIAIDQAGVVKGPDFVFVHHLSLVVLTPLSDAGKEWVAEHLPQDCQRFARGVAIEPRYWDAIYTGIQADGLDIR